MSFEKNSLFSDDEDEAPPAKKRKIEAPRDPPRKTISGSEKFKKNDHQKPRNDYRQIRRSSDIENREPPNLAQPDHPNEFPRILNNQGMEKKGSPTKYFEPYEKPLPKELRFRKKQETATKTTEENPNWNKKYNGCVSYDIVQEQGKVHSVKVQHSDDQSLVKKTVIAKDKQVVERSPQKAAQKRNDRDSGQSSQQASQVNNMVSEKKIVNKHVWSISPDRDHHSSKTSHRSRREAYEQSRGYSPPETRSRSKSRSTSREDVKEKGRERSSRPRSRSRQPSRRSPPVLRSASRSRSNSLPPETEKVRQSRRGRSTESRNKTERYLQSKQSRSRSSPRENNKKGIPDNRRVTRSQSRSRNVEPKSLESRNPDSPRRLRPRSRSKSIEPMKYSDCPCCSENDRSRSRSQTKTKQDYGKKRSRSRSGVGKDRSKERNRSRATKNCEKERSQSRSGVGEDNRKERKSRSRSRQRREPAEKPRSPPETRSRSKSRSTTREDAKKKRKGSDDDNKKKTDEKIEKKKHGSSEHGRSKKPDEKNAGEKIRTHKDSSSGHSEKSKHGDDKSKRTEKINKEKHASSKRTSPRETTREEDSSRNRHSQGSSGSGAAASENDRHKRRKPNPGQLKVDNKIEAENKTKKERTDIKEFVIQGSNVQIDANKSYLDNNSNLEAQTSPAKPSKPEASQSKSTQKEELKKEIKLREKERKKKEEKKKQSLVQELVKERILELKRKEQEEKKELQRKKEEEKMKLERERQKKKKERDEEKVNKHKQDEAKHRKQNIREGKKNEKGRKEHDTDRTKRKKANETIPVEQNFPTDTAAIINNNNELSESNRERSPEYRHKKIRRISRVTEEKQLSDEITNDEPEKNEKPETILADVNSSFHKVPDSLIKPLKVKKSYSTESCSFYPKDSEDKEKCLIKVRRYSDGDKLLEEKMEEFLNLTSLPATDSAEPLDMTSSAVDLRVRKEPHDVRIEVSQEAPMDLVNTISTSEVMPETPAPQTCLTTCLNDQYENISDAEGEDDPPLNSRCSTPATVIYSEGEDLMHRNWLESRRVLDSEQPATNSEEPANQNESTEPPASQSGLTEPHSGPEKPTSPSRDTEPPSNSEKPTNPSDLAEPPSSAQEPTDQSEPTEPASEELNQCRNLISSDQLTLICELTVLLHSHYRTIKDKESRMEETKNERVKNIYKKELEDSRKTYRELLVENSNELLECYDRISSEHGCDVTLQAISNASNIEVEEVSNLIFSLMQSESYDASHSNTLPETQTEERNEIESRQNVSVEAQPESAKRAEKELNNVHAPPFSNVSSSAPNVQHAVMSPPYVAPPSSSAPNAQPVVAPLPYVSPQSSSAPLVQPVVMHPPYVPPASSSAPNVQSAVMSPPYVVPQSSSAANVQPRVAPPTYVSPQSSSAPNVQPMVLSPPYVSPQYTYPPYVASTPVHFLVFSPPHPASISVPNVQAPFPNQSSPSASTQQRHVYTRWQPPGTPMSIPTFYAGQPYFPASSSVPYGHQYRSEVVHPSQPNANSTFRPRQPEAAPNKRAKKPAKNPRTKQAEPKDKQKAGRKTAAARNSQIETKEAEKCTTQEKRTPEQVEPQQRDRMERNEGEEQEVCGKPAEILRNQPAPQDSGPQPDPAVSNKQGQNEKAERCSEKEKQTQDQTVQAVPEQADRVQRKAEEKQEAAGQTRRKGPRVKAEKETADLEGRTYEKGEVIKREIFYSESTSENVITSLSSTASAVSGSATAAASTSTVSSSTRITATTTPISSTSAGATGATPQIKKEGYEMKRVNKIVDMVDLADDDDDDDGCNVVEVVSEKEKRDKETKIEKDVAEEEEREVGEGNGEQNEIESGEAERTAVTEGEDDQDLDENEDQNTDDEEAAGGNKMLPLPSLEQIEGNARMRSCAEENCHSIARFRCASCTSVIYCSIGCQKLHWDMRHSTACLYLSKLRQHM